MGLQGHPSLRNNLAARLYFELVAEIPRSKARSCEGSVTGCRQWNVMQEQSWAEERLSSGLQSRGKFALGRNWDGDVILFKMKRVPSARLGDHRPGSVSNWVVEMGWVKQERRNILRTHAYLASISSFMEGVHWYSGSVMDPIPLCSLRCTLEASEILMKTPDPRRQQPVTGVNLLDVGASVWARFSAELSKQLAVERQWQPGPDSHKLDREDKAVAASFLSWWIPIVCLLQFSRSCKKQLGQKEWTNLLRGWRRHSGRSIRPKSCRPLVESHRRRTSKMR